MAVITVHWAQEVTYRNSTIGRSTGRRSEPRAARPLTSSLMVNEEECLRLIDQMRISVPSAIKEGERMLSERDRILAEARAEAARIVSEAEDQVTDLVSEQHVIDLAEIQARDLEEQGYQKALNLVQQGEEYVVDLLEQMSAHLNNAVREVENGLRTMQEDPADPKRAKTRRSNRTGSPFRCRTTIVGILPLF